MAKSTKKTTEKKAGNIDAALVRHGGLGGMPAEKALFERLRELAVSVNDLGIGIQQVYSCKTPVLKTDIKIPSVKAVKDPDELGGITAEKSLFAQLKTISSSLNKMTTTVQKNIQKSVKVNAAAKRAAAKKPAAKKGATKKG
ncbi:MAG: hypothetical protein SPL52_15485 [Fibrobacter sp.]|nr:hypothetical protein [Fibrobacter sp.]